MRMTHNDFPLQLEEAYEPSAGRGIGDMDILGALRRGWYLPILGCFIGLTAAFFYIQIAAPTLYKSSARILVDRSMNRYLQTNKIVAEPVFDQAEMESQVHILSSESIVVPVVRSMNLASDSEFVGPPDTLGAKLLWKINRLIGIVKRSIGRNDDVKIDPDAALERTAVEAVLNRLSVYREDVANVINVTFASENPNKAANIANAIADTYLATSLEARSQSTKLATLWLQDRLTELKVQAMDADRALQNYKAAYNLANTAKGAVNSEQLASLNTQLTNARVAMAEAKARIERIQQQTKDGVPSATVSDVLNSGVIAKLRSQYLDLATKAAEVGSRVGRDHAAVVKLHERMAELRLSIREEEQRIAGSYASEYAIAKARESELAGTLAQLAGEAKTIGQAQVTMRDLESSADSLRQLYNNFLQKFQEMSTAQAQDIGVQDARIVTRAAAPLHKSSRKAGLVLAGSIVLGLFLGVGAAVAREWIADVFRTPNAVKQVTGIDCLVLPAVNTAPKQTALLNGRAPPPIEEYVLYKPYSRFAETLRCVKALINTAQLKHSVKVIGIVSSVAKEGKTTIAANLASLIIATSGARTLIIDGDLHLRLLTARLAPDARQGLIEALADPSQLTALVCRRPRSGLHILPCVLSTRIPNAAELLGSTQMEVLLAAARKDYDYIIIEIPPIMSVVDVRMIGRFIDRFIFIAEWGATKRGLILEALSESQIARERFLGVVLNKADPTALGRIEAYKGKRFTDYYEG